MNRRDAMKFAGIALAAQATVALPFAVDAGEGIASQKHKRNIRLFRISLNSRRMTEIEWDEAQVGDNVIIVTDYFDGRVYSGPKGPEARITIELEDYGVVVANHRGKGSGPWLTLRKYEREK